MARLVRKAADIVGRLRDTSVLGLVLAEVRGEDPIHVHVAGHVVTHRFRAPTRQRERDGLQLPRRVLAHVVVHVHGQREGCGRGRGGDGLVAIGDWPGLEAEVHEGREGEGYGPKPNGVVALLSGETQQTRACTPSIAAARRFSNAASAVFTAVADGGSECEP